MTLHILGLSRLYWRRAGPYWAGAAEMELMEMSYRRPGEAWSVPALAAPAVAGEQVARPVKPCNAPATKFSVGRGHRSFTAEVAFCPVNGDSLKVAPSVLMMTSPSASRRSQQVLPLQPSNVNGLEVLANGVVEGCWLISKSIGKK
jgi:hypothetical protein